MKLLSFFTFFPTPPPLGPVPYPGFHFGVGCIPGVLEYSSKEEVQPRMIFHFYYGVKTIIIFRLSCII